MKNMLNMSINAAIDAGKSVCKLPDGGALLYNKENLLNPYFVVK